MTTDNSSLTIDRSSFALLYLFIGFYSLLHIMTWAMTRYRLPVDAVLLVFAALGIGDLIDRIAAWRPGGPAAQASHECQMTTWVGGAFHRRLAAGLKHFVQ